MLFGSFCLLLYLADCNGSEVNDNLLLWIMEIDTRTPGSGVPDKMRHFCTASYFQRIIHQNGDIATPNDNPVRHVYWDGGGGAV